MSFYFQFVVGVGHGISAIAVQHDDRCPICERYLSGGKRHPRRIILGIIPDFIGAL
jgi:hypothetical protein